MNMSELREKDTGSLQSMEKELTENLFAARLQKRTGQLENTAKIQLTKRELAQVKTVLRARELGLEVIETASPDAKKVKPNHDGKTQAAKAAGKPSKPVSKKHAAKHAAKTAKVAKKGKAPEKKKAAAPKAKSKSAAKPAAKKAEKKTAGKKK